MKVKDLRRQKQLKIIISGSGGQGIMLLGKLIASLAAKNGKHATWIPSYGAEMRGGSAYCFVKVSDTPIASPIIEKPDMGIIFNTLAFERFKKDLKSCKVLIINSNFIKGAGLPASVKRIDLPLNTMATECGNIKVANIIALGILSALKLDFVSYRDALNTLNSTFLNKEILEKNIKAFHAGIDYFESISRQRS